MNYETLKEYSVKRNKINKLIFKLNEKKCEVMKYIMSLNRRNAFRSDDSENNELTVLISSLCKIPYEICELYKKYISDMLILFCCDKDEYEKKNNLKKKLMINKTFRGCNTLVECFKYGHNKKILNEFFNKFNFTDERDIEILVNLSKKSNIDETEKKLLDKIIESFRLKSSTDKKIKEESDIKTKEKSDEKIEKINENTKMDEDEIILTFALDKDEREKIQEEELKLASLFVKDLYEYSECEEFEHVENKHFDKLNSFYILDISPLGNICSHDKLKISLHYVNYVERSANGMKYDIVFDDDTTNIYKRNISDVESFVNNLYLEILSLNDDFYKTVKQLRMLNEAALQDPKKFK